MHLIYLVLQILGAFAVRDGVPMQGMKIKNVVPGEVSHSMFTITSQYTLLRGFDTRNTAPRSMAAYCAFDSNCTSAVLQVSWEVFPS